MHSRQMKLQIIFIFSILFGAKKPPTYDLTVPFMFLKRLLHEIFAYLHGYL